MSNWQHREKWQYIGNNRKISGVTWFKFLGGLKIKSQKDVLCFFQQQKSFRVRFYNPYNCI